MTSPASSFLSSNIASAGAKQKVVAGYALQQRLGSGSFATVYKGVRLPAPDGQRPTEAPDTVAIKAITRASEKLTKKVLENLDIEISILRTYRHPNIVCLHDVQKTERHFYLILEYCAGGDVQKLIRTRKAGRLSEGLTRRLMRDLASGLGFLWGQELIHRDIKPQNLLLTGPLPMDELDDPERTLELEDRRREVNFPSDAFSLKIADFGFARHLQTTSLAETLCGSPLYMAPEILQHHRYDAKADLWSVGTVLFEMVSGRPPFHGENHIDLLRNIQRKAVRLPPDVRVSVQCVNLLRLLLNRNPLSRAGFKEFFDACDAFVGLGCRGTGKVQTRQWEKRTTMDLGTIQENEVDNAPGTASMITVATATHITPAPSQSDDTTDVQAGNTTNNNPTPAFVTPPFGPVATPMHLVSNYHETTLAVRPTDGSSRAFQVLQPLQSSPPIPDVAAMASRMQALPMFDNRVHNYQIADTGRRIDSSQNSTDESGFVIVELGSGQRNDLQSLSTSGTELVDFNRNRDMRGAALQPSPPTSPIFNVTTNPVVTSRGDYMVVNDPVNRRLTKGMLSTSPGTGGALMGLVGGRARSLYEAVGGTIGTNRLESQIDSLTKMLAASEDVGRRAVSVAHLGDARAYLAIRCIAMNEEGASLVSTSPMDCVVEDHGRSSGEVTDDTSSTEVMGPARRRSSSATMTEAKIEEDDEAEEMPFAVSPESPSSKISTGMPSRTGHSYVYGKATKSIMKTGPSVIRSHFGEAIACYMKGLSMLKGALGGVKNLTKDLDAIASQRALSATQRQHVQKLQKRKDVTISWLSGQFRGVLERADAANNEINKYPTISSTEQDETLRVKSVDELIYNHSLACGRDGAVKHLLGQFDAARSCYRSAGLLAETLLMETNIGNDDRKILEGYVDGFAARITELDEMMLQQSRSMGSNASSSCITGSRRSGSGVIGLIGPNPASMTFGLGVLRMGNNNNNIS